MKLNASRTTPNARTTSLFDDAVATKIPLTEATEKEYLRCLLSCIHRTPRVLFTIRCLEMAIWLSDDDVEIMEEACQTDEMKPLEYLKHINQLHLTQNSNN